MNKKMMFGMTQQKMRATDFPTRERGTRSTSTIDDQDFGDNNSDGWIGFDHRHSDTTDFYGILTFLREMSSYKVVSLLYYTSSTVFPSFFGAMIEKMVGSFMGDIFFFRTTWFFRTILNTNTQIDLFIICIEEQ